MYVLYFYSSDLNFPANTCNIYGNYHWLFMCDVLMSLDNEKYTSERTKIVSGS